MGGDIDTRIEIKRLLLQKMCLVRKPAFVQEFGFVRVHPATFGWFRIHSMYCYDVNLFRDRWLGPPGVPRFFFYASNLH